MRTVALGEVANIVSGATPKTGVAKYWGGEVQWATPADLSKLAGAYIDRTPRTLTEEGVHSCATTVLPAGSVLLSSRAPIGHVAINKVPMATNQGFKTLVPGPGLDAKFLYHWMKASTGYLQSLGNGATFKELSKGTVARIQIPLPPLDDQRRIANILDKAEALRAKRHKAIKHLDAFGQSIFHDMFGESQNWPVSRLDLLAMPEKGSIRTGPFGSQLLTSEFTTSGIAVLGIDNTVGNEFSWRERRFISEEKYEQLKRYTVHPGDLIITIMGTLGRCAVVPDDIPRAINTKHLCCVTLDQQQADPAYVHAYFLHHPMAARHLRQTTNGSIMAGLNMGIIKAMPVVVPPVELQREFTKRVSAVEPLKNAHRAQLSKLDNLISSLQDRAFKGEL